MVYIWLAVGGAIGTVSRYLVTNWTAGRLGSPPWGTFVVNISGAFIIGLFLTLIEERSLDSPSLRAFIAIGILGGYTTFSTLSFETLRLLREGAMISALMNGLGSLVAGLVAVSLGVIVGRLI